ncbi:hypothetical protein [Enterococcus villorum]|uniref:Uncharacterized protein n=2 Tax=Enterococcus villorum TaxID=112904 RepID=A0A511J301_9ENTE|nr:hypothetical protein EVI01_17070 [Enterococcus villorum]
MIDMTKKIYVMGAAVAVLGGMLILGKNNSFAEEVEDKNAVSSQEEMTTETAESTLGNWEMGTETHEESIKEEKEYFQKKYGYENKFYTLDSDDLMISDVDGKDNLKEEFNPVTGILRITDLDTGEVEEQDHYEDIKPIEGATPVFE